MLETKIKKQIGLGRLGNVLFTYRKGEEDLDIFGDGWLHERRIIDRNALKNVIELIHPSAYEFIGYKKIDEKANFSGDITWSVLLPDDKFKKWHEYEALIDWEFYEKEGIKVECEFCGKEIKSYKELTRWGGPDYHVKDCFTKAVNKEFDYYDYFNRLDLLEYLLKKIRVFDPENEKRKEFETKANLCFIPWHISQAYYLTNDYIWHATEEDEDEYYKKKGEEGVIKDINAEINNALSKFDEVADFFNENRRDLVEKYPMRFKVLLNKGKFIERIEEVFKKGRVLNGIEIEELEDYQKIKKQCRSLLKYI